MFIFKKLAVIFKFISEEKIRIRVSGGKIRFLALERPTKYSELNM